MRNPRGWVMLGFALALALLAAAIPITLKGLAQKRVIRAIVPTGGDVIFETTGRMRKLLARLIGPEFINDIMIVRVGPGNPSEGPQHDPAAWADLLSKMHDLSSLQSLEFESCEVDRRCLEKIGQLKSLAVLKLNCPSGADLAPLSGLEFLQELTLNQASEITPAALAILARLPALRTLSLSHSDLRGSSLAKFQDFQHLEFLDLRHVRLNCQDLLLLDGAAPLAEVAIGPDLENLEALDDVRSALPHIKFEVESGP